MIRTRHALFDEPACPSIAKDKGGAVFKAEDYFVEEVSAVSSPVLPQTVPVPAPIISQSKIPAVLPTPASSTLISSNISVNHILPYRQRGPRAFVTSALDVIPHHYNQAINSRESVGWLSAIKTELDAMERLGVWEVVDRSPEMKTVGTTRVFKKKEDCNADVVFKARLCAQGFSQTQGVDFLKTFAPTGRLNSL